MHRSSRSGLALLRKAYASSEKGMVLDEYLTLEWHEAESKRSGREQLTIPASIEPLDMIGMRVRQECRQDIQVSSAPKVYSDAAASVHRNYDAINHCIDTLVDTAARIMELCMKPPKLQACRKPFG